MRSRLALFSVLSTLCPPLLQSLGPPAPSVAATCRSSSAEDQHGGQSPLRSRQAPKPPQPTRASVHRSILAAAPAPKLLRSGLIAPSLVSVQTPALAPVPSRNISRSPQGGPHRSVTIKPQNQGKKPTRRPARPLRASASITAQNPDVFRAVQLCLYQRAARCRCADQLDGQCLH